MSSSDNNKEQLWFWLKMYQKDTMRESSSLPRLIKIYSWTGMMMKSVRTMSQIINECLIYYHSHELPNIDLMLKSLESTHP